MKRETTNGKVFDASDSHLRYQEAWNNTNKLMKWMEISFFISSVLFLFMDLTSLLKRKKVKKGGRSFIGWFILFISFKALALNLFYLQLKNKFFREYFWKMKKHRIRKRRIAFGKMKNKQTTATTASWVDNNEHFLLFCCRIFSTRFCCWCLQLMCVIMLDRISFNLVFMKMFLLNFLCNMWL